ncbi:hypothetical protein [Yersinia pekkanenii]|uniref:Phage-like protein n=1 Tax=Yersinia pekkanenii TaxID=1288385 RepID=A0A0T9RIF4_9GAMM|nr:hypothetical protein [Yersinia pekkanenii]CNI64598.1 Uncharacterised protein [Yersinia pekkanenii]CRY64847.1 Uncharacterised protein [Yersinia pekkanenii]
MSHFLKGLSADKFNQKYPVGSSFNYFPIMGIPDSVEVVTRTEAWALDYGAVVVSIIGRAGGVSIEHLKPIVIADSLQQNLEELKKAALGANLYGWTGIGDQLQTEGYPELMAQFIEHCTPSVIIDLIAQLEAAQKLNPLSVNVSELEATYIGDIRLHMAAISDWKSRTEKAEAALSAANEKPIVLPHRYSVDCGVCEDPNGAWVAVDEIIEAIKAAGFTVEGNADAE